ncbi:MAG: glycosyltransferase [Deinococcota bacterium]
MARIVLQSFGSWGDVQPFIRLGRALKQKGHIAVIATLPHYQPAILEARLEFYPIRPYIDPTDPDLLKRSMQPMSGFCYLLKRVAFTNLDETYVDTLNATADADVFVTGSLSFLGPLIAARQGIPWVRGVLQPSLLLSRYDPPLFAATLTGRCIQRSKPLYSFLVAWLRCHSRVWAKPLFELEKRSGLSDIITANTSTMTSNNHLKQPETSLNHPIFGTRGSQQTLALFSKHFAPPQADWPANTLTTGFLFDDAAASLPRELAAFISSGSAPIVITLGSAAIQQGQDLIPRLIQATRALNRRVVVVSDTVSLTRQIDKVMMIKKAHHSALFPHAGVIVHHGGMGTTADALRAARPTLVLPFSQDQPDHALRVDRLGVGLMLNPQVAAVRNIQRKLRRLIKEPSFEKNVQVLTSKLEQENGLTIACDAIEAVL